MRADKSAMCAINRHLRLIQHVVIDTDLSIDTLELTVRCASTEIASTNGKDDTFRISYQAYLLLMLSLIGNYGL